MSVKIKEKIMNKKHSENADTSTSLTLTSDLYLCQGHGISNTRHMHEVCHGLIGTRSITTMQFLCKICLSN